MEHKRINEAFRTYQKLINFFSEEELKDEQQVLALLNARDELYQALKRFPLPRRQILAEIKSLDQELQQLAFKMVMLLDFSAYRKSFPKSSEQWWWSLEEQPPTHPRGRYNWLFNGLTVGTWAVCLALLVDISRRFILGGAGAAGLSAVTLSTIVSLLKARNDLTDAGQQGFQKLIKKLGVPTYLEAEAKFCTTALMNIALMVFWFSLPSISQHYNSHGQRDQEKGKLGSAEQFYKLAISLNPNNADAHYNLGTLFEDIQELEKAKTQYLIAVRGEFPEAYNNLARLYLQNPKPEPNKAVALLNQGRHLDSDNDGTPDVNNSTPDVKYNIFKNLGWARLMQGLPHNSEAYLDIAIEISKTDDDHYIRNPASAYCLLGQALEAKDPALPTSLQAWQRCCQLGNSSNPDEDAWLLKARKRIEKKGFDYNKVCLPNTAPIS